MGLNIQDRNVPLQSLQFTENQLDKIKQEIFVYETAQQIYSYELKLEMEALIA